MILVLLLCSVNKILYRNLFSNIRLTLVMIYYPFYAFLDLIYLMFVKDVCIYNYQGYWYIVSCNSLLVFYIKLILISSIRFGNVSSSSIFGRICTVFFFKCLDFTSEAIWACSFLYRKFITSQDWFPTLI